MLGSTGMAYSSNVGRPKRLAGGVRNTKTSKIIPVITFFTIFHLFFCWFPEVESRWCCGGTHPNQFGLSGFEQAKYGTKWGMSDAMLKISDVSLGYPQII